MCGIVGYLGPRPTTEILLDALGRLEYRGYDSAGIAVATHQGLAVVKATGKLERLRSALGHEMPVGTAGIGHTRWATHGRPSQANAHPHIDTDGQIAVIHNGIVENHALLRSELAADGHVFRSETDTEVLPHLLERAMRRGKDLVSATVELLERVEGALALVVLSEHHPERLIAARVGNAGGVVVGFGDGEMFVASDLPAILPFTRRVVFLESMQFAVIDRQGASFYDASGKRLYPAIETVQYDPVSAARGGYKHFMLKEIMEQPTTITDTLRSMVDLVEGTLALDQVPFSDQELRDLHRVVLVGMGTSMYAAQVGRVMIEALARLPAEADNANEFAYRDPVVDARTLVVSISQSGETVDTLAAMETARNAGAPQVTICNVDGAQSTRLAQGRVMIRCGAEVGVASTKCFTASLLACYLLALHLARARGTLGMLEFAGLVRELARLPHWMSEALESHQSVENLAHALYRYSNFLFLGRGVTYPVAMEGALKLKEVSYIHAEGYPAGEMKHGPIALIDENIPVVALALQDQTRAKMLNNIEEVRARDGKVIAIATRGDAEVAARAHRTIFVPPVPHLLSPLVAVIPLQLLAYEIAVRRGCDVDQPRNLAKTVTVE